MSSNQCEVNILVKPIDLLLHSEPMVLQKKNHANKKPYSALKKQQLYV